MSPVEALRGARELLSDPKRWTQHWFAKDSDDEDTEATDPKAVCWCLSGALTRSSTGYGNVYQVAYATLAELAGGSVTEFNDAPGRDHDEILDLLDRAIAKAEAAHV